MFLRRKGTKWYIVESYRDGGQPRQRILKYVGVVSRADAERALLTRNANREGLMARTAKAKSVVETIVDIGSDRRPTKTILVRIDDLHIDPKYQRHARDHRVKRFAEHFDPNMCTPLIVNRRSSGKLFIIDGNHRRNVLQKSGHKEWEAWVFEGLSSSEEAKLFDRLNTERTNASAAERFRARLHYRDPVAVTIVDTVSACGFRVVLEQGCHKKDGRAIYATSALDTIFRKSNQGGLRTVLELIASCWDEDELACTDAITLKGMHYVLSHDAWKDRIDLNHLRKKLSAVPILKLIRKARAWQVYDGQSAILLFAEAVVEQNNKGLRKKAGPPYLPPRGRDGK
jgi:ribosomal protein S17